MAAFNQENSGLADSTSVEEHQFFYKRSCINIFVGFAHNGFVMTSDEQHRIKGHHSNQKNALLWNWHFFKCRNINIILHGNTAEDIHTGNTAEDIHTGNTAEDILHGNTAEHVYPSGTHRQILETGISYEENGLAINLKLNIFNCTNVRIGVKDTIDVAAEFFTEDFGFSTAVDGPDRRERVPFRDGQAWLHALGVEIQRAESPTRGNILSASSVIKRVQENSINYFRILDGLYYY